MHRLGIALLAALAALVVSSTAFAASATLTGLKVQGPVVHPANGMYSDVCGQDYAQGGDSFSYTVTGQATGPYTGRYAESGRGHVISNGYSEWLWDLEATFRIDSPQGTITGTKTYVYTGPKPGSATCVQQIIGSLILRLPNISDQEFRYAAQLPDGTTDEGTARFTLRDTRSIKSFNGSFTSTRPAAPPDTSPPVIELPADLAVDADGPDGAAVTYTVRASDARDPAPQVSCAPPSGSTFAIGTTTVVCTASDRSGNSSSGSFLVKVAPRDSTSPTLSVPASVTVEADTRGGSRVAYVATAADDVDPAPSLLCTPASGALFPVGTTAVSCEATDRAGNRASASFEVTVDDTTPPSLDVPEDIVIEAADRNGTPVEFRVGASDVVDVRVMATCTPASGSTFPLGATVVECEAADAAGNVGRGSFAVRVVDTTPPLLRLPSDYTYAVDSPSKLGLLGVRPDWTTYATDLVDGGLPVTCSPPSHVDLPFGYNTITCTSVDRSGNRATGMFVVRVPDPADIAAAFIDKWCPQVGQVLGPTADVLCRRVVGAVVDNAVFGALTTQLVQLQTRLSQAVRTLLQALTSPRPALQELARGLASVAITVEVAVRNLVVKAIDELDAKLAALGDARLGQLRGSLAAVRADVAAGRDPAENMRPLLREVKRLENRGGVPLPDGLSAQVKLIGAGGGAPQIDRSLVIGP